MICNKILDARVISSKKLSAAISEEMEGNVKISIQLLKEGLDSLSEYYSSDNVIDDSGMHLVLAHQAEISGDLISTLKIYKRVLETRVAIITEKYSDMHCSDK
ncbi:hypothetical protein VT06_16745 [Arsukibacterium sp. MJ3]|uniref:hypothetical protein n=1 Tax=Arsukibacterium sp. MJ3 TaxID=1632859 RepID=UPI0006272732|nr:hypothetical protein [Arsukibacterium sp. MJ3]KKO47503.1 hypothetical protein VT06_16745 [Arsukibacterium sp. MJ3]